VKKNIENNLNENIWIRYNKIAKDKDGLKLNKKGSL